jgi:cytochrome c-type biogenesis protein CcmH
MKKMAFILILMLALIATGVADAQGGGPTDDEVNAIAKNLYCPVCESVPLDVCGTLACQQWRQQISDKLVEGLSEQEIYDFFVEQYGDRVVASPPARGLNWLIYILPPLAILGGGFLYYRTINEGKKEKGQREVKTASKSTKYTKQIEEELDSRR